MLNMKLFKAHNVYVCEKERDRESLIDGCSKYYV